ncbi:uncharacterized protein LOC131953661 [Physella acuta]|uniref:uncharacterized protein LOC131953661 n=1 Tax=Physella acuta TaxID=109671 RepID=UPI0027DE14C9|nr:uncharacterized protein LOC131953661 [Physella acuta]XP_059172945.1 uncharacterized protein LOC131953661 [Physella acuta]XP_059172946.1 uncharacterized protein LOC131953661 [Physella acuta]XP_059172947.1 uncharacterized protein LOC131953661 [Physella acuta]
MASCVLITAIICVLITTVAIIVAFATPNWVKYHNQVPGSGVCKCGDCDCGMWLQCEGGVQDGSIDNCKWYFADEYRIERDLPDWFKAVQGLMTCSIATSLIALIIGLFSLCCSCKHCSPHQAAITFVFLTFMLVTASVCVFGAKGYMDYGYTVVAEDSSDKQKMFGWSFWVAVGAAGMSLISSILYLCVDRSDIGYIN